MITSFFTSLHKKVGILRQSRGALFCEPLKAARRDRYASQRLYRLKHDFQALGHNLNQLFAWHRLVLWLEYRESE